MNDTWPFENGHFAGKTGTPEIKKQTLKKQVIEFLYFQGPATIADLCTPARVSIPTMASIVNDLIEEGWIRRLGMAHSRGGRRPALYGLEKTIKYIVGVDISRQYTRIAIFNLHNEPIDDILEIDEGLETDNNLLKAIKNKVNHLLLQNKINKSQVLGYGISIPGLIDTKNGINYTFPHFGKKPMAETFSELLKGPAFIEHDTKALTVGESWFGLAKNKSNVLCLYIGSGIGLGIMINGKIYQGHSGYSGEFGHIQIVPDGELCHCGKIGCLETVASGKSIVAKARKMILQGSNTLIKKIVADDVDQIGLNHLLEAAKLGDQFAIELFEDAGEYIARGLAILIHLMNPEMIIIGGEMSQAGNLLSDPIQQKLNKYAISRIRQDTAIHMSNLGDKAFLLGTICVVMRNIFSDDLFNQNHNQH